MFGIRIIDPLWSKQLVNNGVHWPKINAKYVLPAADTWPDDAPFVLPAPGRKGNFIFMADKWRPRNLADSRYIWLPLILKSGDLFTFVMAGTMGLVNIQIEAIISSLANST